MPPKLFTAVAAIGSAILLVAITRWRLKSERVRRRRRKKDRSINIGAIFGMDVGGTLAKIVYFEKIIRNDSNDDNSASSDSSSPRLEYAGKRRTQKKSLWQRDVKEYMKKMTLADIESTKEFPYLVVNIGSGVSILKVNGPGAFERVSGTSLGG
eukprot:gene42146-55966_t